MFFRRKIERQLDVSDDVSKVLAKKYDEEKASQEKVSDALDGLNAVLRELSGVKGISRD